MSDSLCVEYKISGDDFTTAGEASSDVKRMLRQIGMSPDFVRRVSVAMYEGEINTVIHAHGGTATVTVEPNRVKVVLEDQGPGIPDVELAMKEGYTTAPDSVRALGFGAGMGLPNMKRYSDSLLIESTVGVGTTVTMEFLS